MKNLWIALFLSGCVHETNPACSPDQLRIMEQAYIAEVMSTCSPYKTRISCPDYAAIDAKYKALRNDWVRCQ